MNLTSFCLPLLWLSLTSKGLHKNSDFMIIRVALKYLGILMHYSPLVIGCSSSSLPSSLFEYAYLSFMSASTYFGNTELSKAEQCIGHINLGPSFISFCTVLLTGSSLANIPMMLYS